VFSVLSTIALASVYYELHFSARAKTSEDGVELMGVWMVVSAWVRFSSQSSQSVISSRADSCVVLQLPWSLYLSLFTLFQAVPFLRDHDDSKRHKHRDDGSPVSAEVVAGLGLYVTLPCPPCRILPSDE
jgi:hypothetical protein